MTTMLDPLCKTMRYEESRPPLDKLKINGLYHDLTP